MLPPGIVLDLLWTAGHHAGIWELLGPGDSLLIPATLELDDKNSFNQKYKGGDSGKVPTCQRRRTKRHWFNPPVGKIP